MFYQDDLQQTIGTNDIRKNNAALSVQKMVANKDDKGVQPAVLTYTGECLDQYDVYNVNLVCCDCMASYKSGESSVCADANL